MSFIHFGTEASLLLLLCRLQALLSLHSESEGTLRFFFLNMNQYIVPDFEPARSSRFSSISSAQTNGFDRHWTTTTTTTMTTTATTKENLLLNTEHQGAECVMETLVNSGEKRVTFLPKVCVGSPVRLPTQFKLVEETRKSQEKNVKSCFVVRKF